MWQIALHSLPPCGITSALLLLSMLLLVGRWVMFYEGVAADNARSIGLAVSTDGLSWRRLPQPILAAGPPGAWDCGGVGAPCAAPMAGALQRTVSFWDTYDSCVYIICFCAGWNACERDAMVRCISNRGTRLPFKERTYFGSGSPWRMGLRWCGSPLCHPCVRPDMASQHCQPLKRLLADVLCVSA